MIKLQTHTQVTLACQLHNKLRQKYYGPFQVIKKINELAFIVKLPKNCKIHHTFHISTMKIFKGELSEAQVEIPPIIVNNEVVPILLAIINMRVI